jgi:hypothetical protein
LIASILPPKVLILVGATCLVWITIFSLAFVNLSGLALSNAWLMAGALVFASAAWVLVMIREIRDAVEIPDPYGSGDLSGRKRSHLDRAEISSIFPGDRWFPAETVIRRRPRKARSAKGKTVSQSASSEIFHPDV